MLCIDFRLGMPRRMRCGGFMVVGDVAAGTGEGVAADFAGLSERGDGEDVEEGRIEFVRRLEVLWCPRAGRPVAGRSGVWRCKLGR